MLCRQIAKYDYPVVSMSQSRGEVEKVLKDNGGKAVPVVADGQFMGFVTEEMLGSNKADSVALLFSHLVPQGIGADDHVFRALRLMAHLHVSIIAVLSHNREYVGIITAEDILPAVATLNGLDDAPGGSVTIEMRRSEYSYRTLARLVETNDADILQLNTYVEQDTGLFIVTIKVSREDISNIVATLQRYDYTVRYYFGQETYGNELKANYDALINYLNI
ncbi:MAG: CBS domain-containing protein [Chitinophagaceae bacterium]